MLLVRAQRLLVKQNTGIDINSLVSGTSFINRQDWFLAYPSGSMKTSKQLTSNKRVVDRRSFRLSMGYWWFTFIRNSDNSRTTNLIFVSCPKARNLDVVIPFTYTSLILRRCFVKQLYLTVRSELSFIPAIRCLYNHLKFQVAAEIPLKKKTLNLKYNKKSY